ncbi:UNVERIFIED_CONTAM: hypothetical protein PYX00_010160 [Menopon gallinae]|uniref:Uncharacterized protein n=1 Tax=Menopon gallinae TaxID=328185 RepID=A0AAW2HEG8_9NEOP
MQMRVSTAIDIWTMVCKMKVDNQRMEQKKTADERRKTMYVEWIAGSSARTDGRKKNSKTWLKDGAKDNTAKCPTRWHKSTMFWAHPEANLFGLPSRRHTGRISEMDAPEVKTSDETGTALSYRMLNGIATVGTLLQKSGANPSGRRQKRAPKGVKSTTRGKVERH